MGSKVKQMIHLESAFCLFTVGYFLLHSCLHTFHASWVHLPVQMWLLVLTCLIAELHIHMNLSINGRFKKRFIKDSSGQFSGWLPVFVSVKKDSADPSGPACKKMSSEINAKNMLTSHWITTQKSIISFYCVITGILCQNTQNVSHCLCKEAFTVI